MVTLVVASGDEDAPRPPATAERPATTAERPPEEEAERPAAPQRLTAGRLAIGLTERNAGLLWSRAERPDLALGAWRDRVEALRPAVYRLPVDWAQLQPSPGRAANLAKTEDGCARGAAPCAAFDGIRDELRAVRSQQRAHGGWEVLVVLYGVPPWAARNAGGCERDGTEPRSRPITDRGLAAYRSLARSLLDLARREGVELRWWSPWNEPNQPYFVSPQRTVCETTAPTRAPGVYARLTRALRAELDAAAGDQRLVLGEMAGVDGPSPRVTGVAEFVEGLPDDVACASKVWSQHMYAEPGGRRGPVGQLQRALRRRACTRGARIWVTETGVGGAHAGDDRDTRPGALRANCRLMHRQLRRWQRDPSVDVAIQYSFREDAAFPVGLVDPTLTRAYPTYDVWRAWGGGRRPTDPAPRGIMCR